MKEATRVQVTIDTDDLASVKEAAPGLSDAAALRTLAIAKAREINERRAARQGGGEA